MKKNTHISPVSCGKNEKKIKWMEILNEVDIIAPLQFFFCLQYLKIGLSPTSTTALKKNKNYQRNIQLIPSTWNMYSIDKWDIICKVISNEWTEEKKNKQFIYTKIKHT